jgi:hypothetical protein
MDGKLAVIGVGSIALWQASHLSDSLDFVRPQRFKSTLMRPPRER